MNHVFISYAREDKSQAQTIAQGLGRISIPVWWDERLQLGEEFAPEILGALNQAIAVIVLWSQYSVSSDWVNKEARIARTNGTLLIPVRLDNAIPPGEFAALDCANLQDWRPNKPHTEFDQIVRKLKSLSGVGGGGGEWIAERQARDTLLVHLDRETHTIQYTQGKVFVDGQAATSYGNAISAERTFNFDLSNGDERYMCRLDVRVTMLRGDVRRFTLTIGGQVIYDE